MTATTPTDIRLRRCRVRVVERADEVEFARYLRSGDMVTWGQGCAEPRSLIGALLAQRERVGRLRCFIGLSPSGLIRPEHADHVSFFSYTGSGPNRALLRHGGLDIVPCHYSELPRVVSSAGLGADVVLAQLSRPDERGRYSLGLANDYLSAAIDRARVVMAEVSPHVPWTYNRTLTEDEIDVLVARGLPPTDAPPADITEVDGRVAGNIAALIEDGSTLQIGLGAVPQAVLSAVTNHHDLGIHSGWLGDRVADLMESGVVTNARKTRDRGCAVAGLLMGSSRLAAFAHRNPAIQVRDTAYTHDAEVLAGIDRFVAINSALEVDLTGQINAEMVGTEYVGAVGGAVDFLRGAHRSRGGLPIVGLPSTAGNATRIVARLAGPVSTARSDTGLIVTEFGVADLRGLSLSARRERMLAIAHPAHRDALQAQAASETWGRA